MIFNVGNPLQIGDDIRNFLVRKMLLRHLAEVVGECHLGLLQAAHDRVLADPIVRPRQIRRIVTAESEDRVAAVAVMAFKCVLAGNHMLIQLVGMGEGRELAGCVHGQHQKQYQGQQCANSEDQLGSLVAHFFSFLVGLE